VPEELSELKESSSRTAEAEESRNLPVSKELNLG
jgi:hypothetical protein